MRDYDDPELEAAAAKAAQSRKSDKRWKLLLTLLSLLLAGAVAVVWWLAVSNAELAAENGSFAAQQQGEKKEIAKEAQQALCQEGDKVIFDRELCDKWAEAAQEPVVPTQPPALSTGPSQADLVNAFRTYCAEGNCKGRDGQPPTPDDIAAAFAQFCSGGKCKGPAGADGANGQSVQPTSDMVLAAVTAYCAPGICIGPTGAQGPPPTAEAILAAVQQVCANDACRGPAGADGQPGTDGQPGADGQQGPPPSSFDFAWMGTSYHCVPNPPGSTTFTCEASTPPPLEVKP
jgi:hypothetical protein